MELHKYKIMLFRNFCLDLDGSVGEDATIKGGGSAVSRIWIAF